MGGKILNAFCLYELCLQQNNSGATNLIYDNIVLLFIQNQLCCCKAHMFDKPYCSSFYAFCTSNIFLNGFIKTEPV